MGHARRRVGASSLRGKRGRKRFEDCDSIENSLRSVDPWGSDWSAPVERKFFPNDQAEVVTVNLARPPLPFVPLPAPAVFRAPVFIG